MPSFASTAPTSTVPEARSRYLYAIIAVPEDSGPTILDLEGLDQTRVHTFTSDSLGIAAVVSDMPRSSSTIRPERLKLAAHHGVLQDLMADQPILPMPFGTVADSTEAIHRMLRYNCTAFEEQLARVEGRVEIGLRMSESGSEIAGFVIELRSGFASMRDHLVRGGYESERNRGEKTGLVHHFENLRAADDTLISTRIIEALDGICDEILERPIHHETEIVQVACLVRSDRLKALGHAIVNFASLLEGSGSIHIEGPRPPYHFVDMASVTDSCSDRLGIVDESARLVEIGSARGAGDEASRCSTDPKRHRIAGELTSPGPISETSAPSAVPR